VADTYGNFRQLAAKEEEGKAWAREYEDRGSRILVMAPHGGWIEPFTTELARAVAGRDFSFYSFIGLKDGGNEHLHLTSHRFDEPLGLGAVAEADRVLAIHGEGSRDGLFVMVGGRWEQLVDALRESLEEAGFPVREPREGLTGRHWGNICNRGRLGAGGQLEISEGFRKVLRKDPGKKEPFVLAVRRAVLSLEEKTDP